MKKILAVATIALGVFTIATTTHAADFYVHTIDGSSRLTKCDLLDAYHKNSHAIKGSYLEVNCHFSYFSNGVTIITDNQKLYNYSTSFVGLYDISFQNVNFPKGTLYFLYQKISGGNSPDWEFPAQCFGDCISDTGLPDMKDLNVHVSEDILNKTEQMARYESYFGSWDSGDDEKIAIFACVR